MTRWDHADLYIGATGVCLPPPVPVERAIADGRYTQRDADRTQQLSVTVASAGQPSPPFAATAAKIALARASYPVSEVDILFHAVNVDGYPASNAATWVQREVGMLELDHLVLEVRSGCDGGLMAIEPAAALLLADNRYRAALLTAAAVWPDNFGIDRWLGDSELPFADGGAAIVLTRRPGVARLLATATTTEPALEGLSRGTDPPGLIYGDPAHPFSVNDRAHAFMRTTGISKEDVWRLRERLVRAAVTRATNEAGITISDIDRVVLPFNGRHVYDRSWLTWIDVPLDRTTFPFSRTVGHLGGSDPFAGLDYLITSKLLKPGQTVLIVMDGSGFVCTAVVLRRTDAPISATVLAD